MKRIIKLLVRFILSLIAILIIAFVGLKLAYNEDVPGGIKGDKADELAKNILKTLNYENFKNAKEIHWTFRGVNKYEWKLQENKVNVFWNNYHVNLNTQSPGNSPAYQSGKLVEGERKKEAIAYAVKNFNNDSFWIVAPFKIFDPGTERYLIEEDGKQKLLVKYTSGGTTPGDAYLWEVDENFRPTSFKMWVSILPFDGLKAHWKDWQNTKADFLLAYKKTIFGVEIPVSDLNIIP